MKIIAAVDDSAVTDAVLETAVGLGWRLDADVIAVHVRQDHDDPPAIARAAAAHGVQLSVVDGPPIPTIVALLSATDVLLGVVGSRGHAGGKVPAGHTTAAIASASPTPVVAVPPGASGGAARRVLVPLEGTADRARAASDVVDRLADGGAELVPLHVFVPETVPRCWDQPHHASRAWSTAFLARYAPPAADDLRLRGGDVAETVLAAADTEDVDLVVLAWSQDLTGGHAPVVRALLARGRVPVLLVPIGVDARPAARHGRSRTRR